MITNTPQEIIEITPCYMNQGFWFTANSGEEFGAMDMTDIPLPVPSHLRNRAIRLTFKNVQRRSIDQVKGASAGLAAKLLFGLSKLVDITGNDAKSVILEAARAFLHECEMPVENTTIEIGFGVGVVIPNGKLEITFDT